MSMTLVRMIARPMLSTTFILGGINSLRNSEALAQRAKPVIDRLMPLTDTAAGALPVELDAKSLVRLNGLVHIVGGALLATGRAPRASALMLLATMLPTTLGGHRYWEESDPKARTNQMIHLAKNVSMAGGLLLAAVDTDGKPSLRWLAQHQAQRATVRATQLAHR